ncbi:YadA-like family protein [Veillonella sp. Ser01]
MNKKFLLVAGVLSIVSSNVMGAVTTDVVRGKNIYVAKTTDASGNNEFKVGLNNNLYDLGTATFHSDESGAFTGGNSYISGDTIYISNLDKNNNIYVTPTRVTISNLESGLPKSSATLDSSEFHIQKFDDNWHHHRTIVDHTGIRSTNNDTGKSVWFSTVEIYAGEQQIHGVTAGTDETDAVNVKQLKDYVAANDKDTITTVKAGNNIEVTANGHDYTVSLKKDVVDKIDNATADIAVNKAQIDNLVNQIGNNDAKINNMINNTRHEARRGIASASALAALHPLDYNPDHKVDVMGGVGHYRGKTAVALGTAYRPNENLMFTVGTAINGKDSSVNAGVSYKVGAKDSTYKSQASLAKDVEDLKQMVIKLQAELEEARKK